MNDIKAALELFWLKVNKNGPVPDHRPDLGPCWLWTAAKTSSGYGGVKFQGKMWQSHRFIYHFTVRPVPRQLDVDHLCRNPGCVNPQHLEPVTSRENTMRGVNHVAINAVKSLCSRGHLLSKENTFQSHRKRGERECRSCAKLRYRLKVTVAKARKCGLLR